MALSALELDDLEQYERKRQDIEDRMTLHLFGYAAWCSICFGIGLCGTSAYNKYAAVPLDTSAGNWITAACLILGMLIAVPILLPRFKAMIKKGGDLTGQIAVLTARLSRDQVKKRQLKRDAYR